MPKDVIEHAKAILGSCGGGSTGTIFVIYYPLIITYIIGAYSQSTGIEIIRQHVGQFIERRDGVPSDPENVCLSGGASESIRNVLKLFINRNGKKAGSKLTISLF